MIEKLRTLDDISTNTQLEKNILTICSSYTNKINELVDAVNELQKPIYDPNTTKGLSSLVEPADPYAEQRKWIGKLCKVYDDNDFIHYAVLEKIFDNSNYCYGTQIGDYRHCEPVKQDDDIIYKGE